MGVSAGSSAEQRPDLVFLSVVVPFVNEEEVLPNFVSVLRENLDELQVTYEVLFVDDGSTDGGAAWLTELCASSWQQARVVGLTRNFGHMSALSAGLDQSLGEWVAMLDADLQHPPELIGPMLDLAITNGAYVAQAVRVDRDGDSSMKRVTARAYYGTMRRFGAVESPGNAADFRVINRVVVDQMRGLPERERVYRMLIPWLGYPTVYLEFQAPPRTEGTSKYSMSKMIQLGLSSITSFTTAPLRIATGAGALLGTFGLLAAIFVILNWALGEPSSGWPSLIATMLILGGVQLLAIGILGEYLAKVYEQLKARPLYVLQPPSAAPGPYLPQSSVAPLTAPQPTPSAEHQPTSSAPTASREAPSPGESTSSSPGGPPAVSVTANDSIN